MAKIEKIRNATRNILFGVLLKLYQIIIPFIMRTVMINFMGVQYLGLNSLFISILHVLNLAELGVGSAMVYSMYKPIAQDDDVTICALMKLYKNYYRVIGAVIAIVGIVIAPFIPQLISGDIPADINIYILYLMNLSATVLTYWLFAYKNAIFQAHQRTDISSKVTMVTNTIQYFIQIIVLVLFHNYYYYIIASLLTQIINNFVIAYYADKLYPNFKPKGEVLSEEKKRINNKIKDLFFIKIGSAVVDSVDTIVISSFLGLTLLAVYQNYFYIMNSVYAIVCIIMASITAGVGNSLLTESPEKNYKDFRTLTFIISFILCFCCVCFVGLYQPFMELWVGKKLMLEFPYVILFCIYFYVRLIASIWNVPKDAAGLWHSDRFRALIAAGVNLTLNLIMVHYIGLYGILLSTIISVAFISCPWILHIIFKYVYKRSSKGYLLSLLKYVLCTIVCCLLCMVICNRITVGGFAQLVVNGIISVGISTLFIIAFRHTDEFSNSKQIVKRMVKRG